MAIRLQFLFAIDRVLNLVFVIVVVLLSTYYIIAFAFSKIYCKCYLYASIYTIHPSTLMCAIVVHHIVIYVIMAHSH